MIHAWSLIISFYLFQLGKTACHYAAERGHLQVLQYLYDYVQRSITPPVVNEVRVSLVSPSLYKGGLYMKLVSQLSQRTNESREQLMYKEDS